MQRCTVVVAKNLLLTPEVETLLGNRQAITLSKEPTDDEIDYLIKEILGQIHCC